jgi:transcriptional regulator with XRE-family HTH domain
MTMKKPRHHIGWAIRRVRLAQHRTLNWLATEIGSDAGNVSRIERGLQEPSERLIVNVATALNVSVSELWQLTEGSERLDESGRIIALTGRLKPEALTRLLDYADYLIERQAR